MAHRRGNGFTLIEIMIVVAVVGVLAAIAYPSYQEQVRRSRRADAQAVLTEATQWMERFHTQSNRYADATEFQASGLRYSPKGSTAERAFYRIDLNPGGVTRPPGDLTQTYVLRATRVNGMASDPCGNFVLDSVERRSQTSNARTDCWSR